MPAIPTFAFDHAKLSPSASIEVEWTEEDNTTDVVITIRNEDFRLLFSGDKAGFISNYPPRSFTVVDAGPSPTSEPITYILENCYVGHRTNRFFQSSVVQDYLATITDKVYAHIGESDCSDSE
jgi:hypothetical protein